MRPCNVVEIVTPKKFVLRGLWFGPKKPNRAIVWVHGLTGSVFGESGRISRLVNNDTAVFTFNNRGHDSVTRVSKLLKRGKKKSVLAGAAHESFTDCIDDIEGAINLVKKQKVKHIYLAGHSTGCQKSIYWASKKGRGIRGIILLAPVSDYAGAAKRHGKRKIERAAAFARKLVRQGKPHELLPASVWSEELNDAQRFLSLYSSDSVEEIFCYAQPRKDPKTLKKVNIPILALWAGKDEFADRKPQAIKMWFQKHMVDKSFKFTTIPGVSHSFKGGEKLVAGIIRLWIHRARPKISSSDYVQCAPNTGATIEQNLEAYQRYDERFCD